MADALRQHYGTEIPARIAAMIRDVHPPFQTKAFLAHALNGYDQLPLLQRGHRIAHSLKLHLPEPYPAALEILLASIGSRPASRPGDGGMAPFLYLPHTHFVASYGLDHFEYSMQAQYQLTQRFTCEFSMRPFLEQHTEATLDRLAQWTEDPDAHVRRLVSECTRTRLPWARHLKRFQQDPAPVLTLLERLKDDSALYVRRSVANNLNDIGKDNPHILLRTAQDWHVDAQPNRQWIIRHALRSLTRAGNQEALALLGYEQNPEIRIEALRIQPTTVRMGDSVRIEADIRSLAQQTQPLLVNFALHYCKADGGRRAKVFILGKSSLAAGETVTLGKTISLGSMSTRKHYAGLHPVVLLVNGKAHAQGSFTLLVS